MTTRKSAATQTSVSQEIKEETKVSTQQTTGVNEERIAALEAKLNALVDILNENPNITSNCPKNSEGKRQISL